MIRLSSSVFALLLVLGLVVSGMCQDMLEIERDMTRVVKEVGQSIVSVSAVTGAGQASSPGGFAEMRIHARSVGCGVVFDDGLVLSTASVVGYARYADIKTVSGTEYRGTVVGIDPVSDVAVIKVETSDLRPATFAKAIDIPPGSFVLVLGNAFGTLPSVSMGVLSNVTGTLASQAEPRMLRLAVPINPGDIGGPVVSSAGEIVGMVIGRLTFQPQTRSFQVGDRTVLGFSTGPQASNMSIAIPADRAMGVARDLLEKGSTRRGFLGVQVMDLSDQLKRDFGDRSLAGVMVTSVVPGSPAESIGIVPGDVITSFGAQAIETVGTLGDAVGQAAPGDVVDIRYVRNGEPVRDGVRIGWFVPEFVQQATFLDETTDPDQVRSRIEDLKTEMERLEKQLGDLEENE
jgi:serine protease Do